VATGGPAPGGSGPGEGGGPAYSRIQACIATALATPALIDRVEPYCAIEHTIWQA